MREQQYRKDDKKNKSTQNKNGNDYNFKVNIEYLKKNYLSHAEKVIDKLSQVYYKDNKPIKPKMLTTTQLRNILALSADIYNELMIENSEELSGDILARIQYLSVRYMYVAGRYSEVKRFVEKSNILWILKKIKNKKDYIVYYHYLEALVAYRKYKIQDDE